MISAPCWQRTLGLGLVIATALAVSTSGALLAQAPEGKPAAGGDPFNPSRSADGPADAKATVSAAGTVFTTPEKTVPYVDLTNRYRFVERYTKFEERAQGGLIGQYKVGISEVLKDSVDVAEGQPKTTELSRQSVFTERPAEVNSQGVVSATVRNYSRFQVQPEDVSPPPGPRPLENLTIYVRPQTSQLPLVLSLTVDRRLREREYEVAAHQLFLPNLVGLLPGYAARVGDTWRIPRRAAQALVGDPNTRGDALSGKFLELRRDPNGPRQVAVFSITGRVVNAMADSTLNVEVHFTFLPQPVAARSTLPGAAKTKREAAAADTIEAWGAITEVRMARVATGVMPGAKAARPLKFKSTQELTLQRQVGVAGDPLTLPEIPAATDVNTWLTYVDSQNRFVFHHPQELLPPERPQFVPAEHSGDMVTLVKARPEGPDLVRLSVYDRELKEEDLRGILSAEWEPTKLEVIKGPEEWLPPEEWSGLKVFRIEAALKTGERAKGSTRVHYDGYLLQLGPRLSVIVVATTPRDAVSNFRRDTEQMFKTLKVNAAK